MSDAVVAVADTPVEAVALPTPISVEPRVAPAAEAAEIARQAEEAKLPKDAAKKVEAEPVKAAEKPRTIKEALAASRAKVEAESATPLKVSEAKVESKEAKTEAKAEPKAADAKTAEAPVKAAEPAVARGEDGKFVSTKAPAVEAADKGEPAKAATTEPAKPSFTAEPPPKRFAKAAQDRWAEAPEEVRAEVTRLEKELTAGFEKHRAAATRDSEIQEFHEMAAKGNTTVKEALSKYVNMEQMLRKDPDKGLEALFANIGISPREWATKLLGTAPDVAANKQEQTITELRNELAELKNGLGQIQQERTQHHTATTTEAVQKFAADPAHSRFDELAEDIAFFLKTRHPGDLAKAYEAAERLNPAPVQKEAPAPTPTPAASSAPTATITTLAPAASSAAAARSIAGSPPAGSDPARKQPSRNIKEAIRRATAAVA